MPGALQVSSEFSEQKYRRVSLHPDFDLTNEKLCNVVYCISSESAVGQKVQRESIPYLVFLT